MERQKYPKTLGYRFPAEWEPHRATWVSYPHNESFSWPGTLPAIIPYYHQFISEISVGERVCINVRNELDHNMVKENMELEGQDLSKIDFFIHPTNDAWCRDHGPAFLVNPAARNPKIIVSWQYNAWGHKYPHELDEQIPGLVAKCLSLPVVYPGIVLEGGSVECNGKGTLLTTSLCLLDKNRNPNLKQDQIEKYLRNFYGVEQILWLGNGIDGDNTKGHIDNITRFFSEDAVITMVESDKSDPNHKPLRDNLKMLKTMRLLNGKQLDIVELPMPQPVVYEGQRLPASYANFYITNRAVILPLYRCKEDDRAMTILEECFPSHKVIGIDSVSVLWGPGSFHCLAQQEPEVEVMKKEE